MDLHAYFIKTIKLTCVLNFNNRIVQVWVHKNQYDDEFDLTYDKLGHNGIKDKLLSLFLGCSRLPL